MQKINNLSGKTCNSTVFLIKSADANKVLRRINKFLSQRHLIVFFNLEVPKAFLNRDLNVRSSEEYLSDEDYRAIDEYVFGGLSKDWYRYKNLTEYRGIPLGRIYEYDFQKYLVPRIKNLEIIRRIVELENSARIIAMDDTGELREVAKFYAQLKGIPLREIPLNTRGAIFYRLILNIKNSFAIYLTKLIDLVSCKRLMRLEDSKGLVLLDSRLYKYFKDKVEGTNFVLAPFEKGFGLRMDLLRMRFAYVPFSFCKSKFCAIDIKAAIKKWQEVGREDDFRKIFIYRGIPIWRLVFKRLNNFFLQDFCRIASNIGLIERIIKEKKIKKAVLRNDAKELERTVIFTLRKEHIVSLVAQHGILAEPNGHNKVVADTFAAWGRATVEWYSQFGNSADVFRITGNPEFDRLLDWKPAVTKEELCRRLRLDTSKGIILLATQQVNKFSSFWTDDLFTVMAENVLEAMKEFPDKQLIIKVDPYEEETRYRNIVLESGNNQAAVVRDFDIYTLIYLSQAVITLDSTVGLEAIAFDKPLITFNLTKRQDRVGYAQEGAGLGVHRQEDLVLAIDKALNDVETISKLKMGRDKFKERYAYKIDGRGRERLFDYIKTA